MCQVDMLFKESKWHEALIEREKIYRRQQVEGLASETLDIFLEVIQRFQAEMSSLSWRGMVDYIDQSSTIFSSQTAYEKWRETATLAEKIEVCVLIALCPVVTYHDNVAQEMLKDTLMILCIGMDFLREFKGDRKEVREQ